MENTEQLVSELSDYVYSQIAEKIDAINIFGSDFSDLLPDKKEIKRIKREVKDILSEYLKQQ